jgi:hypothetical protein
MRWDDDTWTIVMTLVSEITVIGELLNLDPEDLAYSFLITSTTITIIYNSDQGKLDSGSKAKHGYQT